MTDHHASLLQASDQEGVRAVASALLADARSAFARLDEGQDALHDFRVAVRRLRCWLQAFRDPLGRGRMRRALRRLRRVARRSSGSRDSEVLVTWLHEVRPVLPMRKTVAVDWLLDELGGPDPHRVARERYAAAFAAAEVRLSRHLPCYTTTHHLDGYRLGPTFGECLASALRTAAVDFLHCAAAVRRASQQAEIHRARIAGKHLRYLLEPMQRHLPGAPELIGDLKRLQDMLGDIHDAQVWLAAIGERVASHQEAPGAPPHTGATVVGSDVPAMPGPDIAPGIIALTRRLRARIRITFRAVATEWLDGRAEDFHDRVVACAEASMALSAAGMEIERKWLLRGVPGEWPPHRTVDIEQGYLPGARLVERVRRTRSGDDVVFHRTVKSGVGLARFEVEEEATREVYEALWPLTSSRRLAKRRHEVVDGALTWVVDVFTDRDLVLAEVELTHVDHLVPLPGWLAPVVDREVTGDPSFSNRALAR